MMLWTDEAVETLKRLALEGRSASAIAAVLGGASRNAVIGKASRIGIALKGGGAPYRAASPASRSPPGPGSAAKKAAWRFADAEVGEMRRLTFEHMRGLACRWPLGDPGSCDFAYCGLTPVEGRSYCAGHCRMAYRPPDARAPRGRPDRVGPRAEPRWL
ncbi:MAG TPA: GcrA family cell cycle regulator [Roseiarcus sp.]|nr:GcrA family cell cycle regulator [Roseiarcus sp.]